MSAKGIGLADIMTGNCHALRLRCAADVRASSITREIPFPHGCAPKTTRRTAGSTARKPASRLDRRPALDAEPVAERIDNMIRQLAHTVAPDVPQPRLRRRHPRQIRPCAAKRRFHSAGGAGLRDKVWAYAREASHAMGIPAHFVVAQAALESGWGRTRNPRADATRASTCLASRPRNWSDLVEAVHHRSTSTARCKRRWKNSVPMAPMPKRFVTTEPAARNRVTRRCCNRTRRFARVCNRRICHRSEYATN